VKRVVKKKATAPTKGNSIIIKYETVDIDTLNPFHKNPRKGDVEKVAESLKSNLMFKAICVNVGTLTGRPREILGGNHTWKAAKSLGWKTIEVAWVDVDDMAANKIVLADNGSSDGSTYDDSILGNLLLDIKDAGGSLIGTTYTDDTLGRLIKMEQAKEDNPFGDVDNVTDAPDDMPGIADLANGVIFQSTLDYDIPELDIDMIPKECPQPIDTWAGFELDLERQEADPSIHWLTVWHAGSRGVNWSNAIACFYTDDFHFDPVYLDPAKNTKKMLNLGMKYAIMPNYTIAREMPVALWVYAAYRSMYVARYFQEAGIQVIPDIQTGGHEDVLDVSLIGIPYGAPVVAAQAQMARGDKDFIRQKARLLKEAEDRLGFKSIIIYGHTDADEVVERADFDCEVIRVQSRTARRREYLNSGATINTQQVQQVHGGKAVSAPKKKVIKRSSVSD